MFPFGLETQDPNLIFASLQKDVDDSKQGPPTVAQVQDSAPEQSNLDSGSFDNIETSEEAKDSSPSIYIDRLIDEAVLEEEIERDFEEYEKRRLGPGSLGITYRYYRNNNDSNATIIEHGAKFRWRQETISNGSFEVLAERLISDGRADEKIKDGRFLFRQQDYVLKDWLQIDSEVGHFRSYTPRLLSRSYRFYLPTTILQGANTRLYNKNTSVSLNIGEIGGYEGVAALSFKKTQGKLYGFGLTHRMNEQWDFGTQFWNTNDPKDRDNHQSYAGVMQYDDGHDLQNHQFHILVDSFEKVGLWYDNRINVGRWRHYSGVFYFAPDLLWTDVPIDNDREGLYWRGDWKSFRWQWNLGSEVSKNNLDNKNDIAGNITTVSFINGNWRFRRKTQFGGSLNIDTRHADSGTAKGDSYFYKLKGFSNHQFPIGRSRLQPSLTINRTPNDDVKIYGLLWDQDWRIRLFNRLNSDIEYLHSDDGSDELNLRLIAEKTILPEIRLTGTFQHIISNDDTSRDSRATSLSMGLSWQFHQNWLLSLNADYNRNVVDTENDDGTGTSINDSTILFSIAYNINTGKTHPLYGLPTGSPGRGRIIGKVFLDENGDGKLGINEKTLKNILVYLDSRFTAETGQEGRFEFWPVASGEHAVSIAIEDVPLPWGLKDDRPLKMRVPVRGEIEIDFALTRLNE